MLWVAAKCGDHKRALEVLVEIKNMDEDSIERVRMTCCMALIEDLGDIAHSI